MNAMDDPSTTTDAFDELVLFLNTLKLSKEYMDYFMRRNVRDIIDMQQVVALTDYHADTELTAFAVKLADQKENLSLDGFRTPMSILEQVKVQKMIRLTNSFPKPVRSDFKDGSYYIGYWEGTERHGRGYMKFPKGIYDGQWEYGKRHGYGLYKFNSGNQFEGMFVNDNYRHGIFTSTNGNIFEGYMSGGKRHGKGTMYYASVNTTYEGDWRDDKKHGHGRTDCEGNIYEGDFRNDLSNGQGIFRWADGSEYSGDFLEGKRQGKGIMKFDNGDVYKGDFLNDKFDGRGLYRSSNGDHYEGGFVLGKKHGKGYWRSEQTADNYRGDFERDLFHGQGLYSYGNGDTYQGEFYAGMRDGNGTFTSPYENSNKDVRGSWKRDQLIMNFNPIPTRKTSL